MKTGPRETLTNLPNAMTFLRMACIPLILLCLGFPGRWGSFLAALFLGIASITDILDGFFARKYGSVTVLGKFLDPLADKLLISITMIMLIPLERIPVWMVIVIIFRELVITAIRIIAVRKGNVLAASLAGKHKTVSQMASIFVILGVIISKAAGKISIEFEPVLDLSIYSLMLITVALTLISGISYVIKNKQIYWVRKDG